MSKVPLLDIAAQFNPIEKEIRAAIDGVLATHRYIQGPEVQGLESEVASYVNAKSGVGVSSGSDALIISLMTLGVGQGDEVITTPYTFFATVGAIARVGAKPVFVDIDPKTYNMNPEKLEQAFTEKTKAIIPVHLYGQATDMDPLLDLCKKRNIAVIEDAAQAIGTEYKGKRAGSMGTVGCFSFFPSKNLGCLGDGGMVTTCDEELAERLRIFRNHGSKPKYYHKFIGGNFRLDALQAAVLRVKLKHLDSWTQARQKNADHYDELFKNADLGEKVITPWRRPGDRHIFNQYVIRAENRDALKKHLTEAGIGNEIYYPLCLHMQECFAHLGYKEGDFPESEKAAQETLAIPIYGELSPEQQSQVVTAIQAFYKS